MIIELNNIKPTYMSEEEVTPSDIYLQSTVVFEKGKKYLVRANSGHGKTSFLDFLYGSNINYSGDINYTQPTAKAAQFNFRVNAISYVFQDYKLFKDLTVFENIQLKNALTNHKSTEEINALIDTVQLSHKKNSLVSSLSLGQKQRVAIVRALCQPFNFILLDEPFSHLDETNIKIITGMIEAELAKQNAGLILTSLGSEYLFNYDKVYNL